MIEDNAENFQAEKFCIDNLFFHFVFQQWVFFKENGNNMTFNTVSVWLLKCWKIVANCVTMQTGKQLIFLDWFLIWKLIISYLKLESFLRNIERSIALAVVLKIFLFNVVILKSVLKSEPRDIIYQLCFKKQINLFSEVPRIASK